MLLASICLVYISIIGKQILSPLIFSFLFAILLLPLANFLEHKFRILRIIAAVMCVVFFITILIGVCYLLGRELSTLASDWPKLKYQIFLTISNIQDWIELTFNVNAAKQTKYVNLQTGKILSTNTSVIGETVLSISSVLLFLIFTFLYTFFILLKRGLLIQFLVSVFDISHSHIVYDVIEQVKHIKTVAR